jgi:N-acetylneuraminic acid mutarotase
MRALVVLALLTACGDDGDGAADANVLDGAGGSSDAPILQRGWQALAPLPGGPRQETSVVSVGPRVYVIGGFDAGGVSDAVEIYETTTGSWSDGPPLPMPMHHTNAAVIGSRIVIAGGMTDLPFVSVGNVYVWDTMGDAGWAAGMSMEAGTERGASAVAAIGNEVYVAGGSRGDVTVTDVARYDIDAETWEPLTALPAARNHLVGAALEDFFFVFGGRDPGPQQVKGEVWRLTSAGWEPRAPMPTPRGGCASAVHEGWVYIMGGEGAPNASGVFSEVEAYRPATDEWTTHEPMLTPRHGTGAATVGDTIYVPGGANVEGFGFVDTFEAFTP